MQKIIDGGDTLVILTKAQADQLAASLKEQSSKLASLGLQHKRLQANHNALINEYGLIKTELSRTNSYNDSLINFLGDNMTLLYKVSKTSDVYFVNLRYHIVDVFPKGTIVLNPPSLLKRDEYGHHISLSPDWRYLNIANELDWDQRHLIDYVRLFPNRLRDYELRDYNLRPPTYNK